LNCRTTIRLPARLKEIAVARARHQGLSFGEFVRRALERAASEPASGRKRKRDPLWEDHAVYDGPVPPDLSERHDDYLYGSEE
jgi:hypothetical protein